MSLPAGVTTCNVIFNTPISFAGGTGTATLTVRPTQTIIWAATGQPLGAFSDTVTTSAQPGSMALPVVDQPGFVDSAGNTVTNWAYTADVLWTVGTQNLSTHKSFQLLTGQTSVTFDLIPDGNTTIAVTAPTATVTSVNGATGPITLDSASVGLSNVDNTSDANKPLSTAATNALALKQDAASLDTTNAGLVNDSASATAAALNAAFVPNWKPNTAYGIGAKVISPNGDTVSAIAGFTSGSSYDAAKWAAKSTTAAPLGGWTAEWSKDAFARPNISDTPAISWATTNTTALASPAIFKPAILGIGSQTLNWDGVNDTVFRYFSGRFNSGNGGNADLALYGATKPGGVAQAAKWPIVISFITDATNTTVEIPFYSSASGALLIEVNGRLLSDASVVYIPQPARQLTLTFPTPASRTIRIWNADGIEAVRVPTGGTLTKPAASPLRVAIIGDSWVNGQGASWGAPPFGATNIESFAPRLLRLMGAGDMILAGIGGTGWVAGTDTGGGSNAYNTRLSAVLAMNPDVLIFYGSQNDGATDPSGTLQAAVASTLASAASVPKVYVISTMLNGYSAANAAVKAATVAAGRRFIDMTNFVYGTGSSVAPAQDGNRDVYLMGSANLHMTFQGHKAAAAAVYAKIMTPGA